MSEALLGLDARPALSRSARLAANALLMGLWLWLYRPVLGYLAIIFSREDFRTNQIVLIGVVALIIFRARHGSSRWQFDMPPSLSPAALGLALGGSLLYLLVERFLDVNTLSASLFGLASYGLLGLWMRPPTWRQGLPAALLLIGTLPFGEHMQTFLGYPLRILTAAMVRDGLQAAGVASVGIDTILIFENGVSQVDIPCSGIRSLWSGALFLIAATWIERRRLNLAWLGLAGVFAVLLVLANLVRVGLLVLVGPVAGWNLAAQMMHVPLGVIGFVAACVAALGLLRRLPALDPPSQTESAMSMPGRPVWLLPGLALATLAMTLAYAPRPQTGLAQSPPAWQFPAELVTMPMPLKPDEVDWLTRDGAESAERRRFEWGKLSGSMILVTSATWRAHHRPERCFEVYGLSLDDSRTVMVAPDFPVRFVDLGGAQRLSAVYWFQSAGRTTDDYATRIWADLSPRRQRWVLVSVLFDGAYQPYAADVQALLAALHAAVAHNLEGG